MADTAPKTVKGVRLNGKDYEVPYRIPVGDVIRDHTATGAYAVLAAIVQQRCVDLSFPICAPTTIVPVDYTMREGVLVYRHTASLILLEAVRRTFPGARVRIVNESGVAGLEARTASYLTAQGMTITGQGPAEFSAFMKKEVERWSKIVKDNKISAGT